MSGVILMLLGIGLTSPLFNNTTQSSLGSINTIVFFNEQNLSDVKSNGSTLIVNGSNISKISILRVFRITSLPEVLYLRTSNSMYGIPC
jgi:hypothetical protein